MKLHGKAVLWPVCAADDTDPVVQQQKRLIFGSTAMSVYSSCIPQVSGPLYFVFQSYRIMTNTSDIKKENARVTRFRGQVPTPEASPAS